MEPVNEAVRAYILEEFLPGQDPEGLLDDTPLISSGVLDSLSTLRLVSFLEETFEIAFKPHEVNPDNLETVESIVKFVESRRSR